MSSEQTAAVDVPDSPLAAHPETAYFWGHVAGSGDLTEACVTIETCDETAADRLAAIAGGTQTDHHIREREYAHDTSITRREDEYTVQVFGDLASRGAAAFGLPLDGDAGGYRLDAFDGHERQFLRGLVESCGTVCFKAETGTVGLSVVHEDRALLAKFQSLLDDLPVAAPYGDVADASSGYYVSVEDDAVPALGAWLYGGSEDSGLFAPTRRRKLERSLDQADGVDATVEGSGP
ncbi:cobalamin biosynthesis protein [Halobacterium bonnevillei]|uniref:Cobalamin biosynthesis protein n=1 Tax=Halobacterium bonnevillei TaxID=2692200 RepID=A0A6B0SIT7_9EURY|nr:cobalamin biosynthesis protein [Halobacterium bonnevillei]MXR19731.1 cobalamin biosynthesis protein [Halobacterium bonnevillei]